MRNGNDVAEWNGEEDLTLDRRDLDAATKAQMPIPQLASHDFARSQSGHVDRIGVGLDLSSVLVLGDTTALIQVKHQSHRS